MLPRLHPLHPAQIAEAAAAAWLPQAPLRSNRLQQAIQPLPRALLKHLVCRRAPSHPFNSKPPPVQAEAAHRLAHITRIILMADHSLASLLQPQRHLALLQVPASSPKAPWDSRILPSSPASNSKPRTSPLSFSETHSRLRPRKLQRLQKAVRDVRRSSSIMQSTMSTRSNKDLAEIQRRTSNSSRFCRLIRRRGALSKR